MPTLSTHAGLGDASLQEQWTALLDADPEASVFQGPRFLRTWQQVLGGDRDLVTVALHDDDAALAGLVVEACSNRDGRTVLELAGGTEVTDYQGPVARPDAAKEFATAWADRLARFEVDELRLAGLPADTGWPDLLATALETVGIATTTERIDVSPVVDLSEGFDAWSAALNGRDRKELRRKPRKLARDLGPVEVVTADHDDLEAGLEQFFGMNGEADGPKATFFDRDEMRRFFGALAEEFHGDGIFRLHQLTVASRVVAANVSLVWRDRWGLYNSAFDPRMGAFSPGNVLVAELVREAADEGLALFDLLRGDEAYKYRFGAVDREIVAVAAGAGDPAGER